LKTKRKGFKLNTMITEIKDWLLINSNLSKIIDADNFAYSNKEVSLKHQEDKGVVSPAYYYKGETVPTQARFMECIEMNDNQKIIESKNLYRSNLREGDILFYNKTYQFFLVDEKFKTVIDNKKIKKVGIKNYVDYPIGEPIYDGSIIEYSYRKVSNWTGDGMRVRGGDNDRSSVTNEIGHDRHYMLDSIELNHDEVPELTQLKRKFHEGKNLRIFTMEIFEKIAVQVLEKKGDIRYGNTLDRNMIQDVYDWEGVTLEIKWAYDALNK